MGRIGGIRHTDQYHQYDTRAAHINADTIEHSPKQNKAPVSCQHRDTSGLSFIATYSRNRDPG